VDTLRNVETLRFSDGSVLSLVKNTAPVVANAVADQSAAEGSTWSFVVPADSFSDADGDTLAYTATLAGGDPLPSWLSFDEATRTFEGTPPADSDHAISIKVTASDGDLSVSDTFEVTINHLPTDIGLSATTVEENVKAGTVVGTLSGTDPDGDIPSFTLLDNPDGVFAIKNGQLVVAAGADIDFETRRSYDVSLRVSDGGGLHHDESFTITVTDVVDHLTGTRAANTLKGGSGADLIEGLGGGDKLYGNAGDDTIAGGAGVDKLYGGDGADTFVFVTGDSGKTRATADTIFDFTSTDGIDLTGWDANSKIAGMQGFDFVGKHAFSGQAGELHFVKDSSDTWIEGDTNGDKKVDFVIHLDDAVTMKAGYFDGLL
jgi:Ca2+-binding RTX toxin-like protein